MKLIYDYLPNRPIRFFYFWRINKMPVISRFLGIIISMYWNDHLPPHLHAKYGEYEVIIDIDIGIIEGKFPK